MDAALQPAPFPRTCTCSAGCGAEGQKKHGELYSAVSCFFHNHMTVIITRRISMAQQALAYVQHSLVRPTPSVTATESSRGKVFAANFNFFLLERKCLPQISICFGRIARVHTSRIIPAIPCGKNHKGSYFWNLMAITRSWLMHIVSAS